MQIPDLFFISSIALDSKSVASIKDSCLSVAVEINCCSSENLGGLPKSVRSSYYDEIWSYKLRFFSSPK